jgi:heme/copper-type cytochrome/quinol oxidase subunit 4
LPVQSIVKMNSTLEEDKSLRYVVRLVASIVLGLVGVYLRFADFRHASIVADVIFVIAVIIMFRIVFAWLEKLND